MIKLLLTEFWIKTLGWTLLHFLWQGTVITAVYAAVRSLLGRSLSPRGRYTLACGTLAAMMIAPPLTFEMVRADSRSLSFASAGAAPWASPLFSSARRPRLLRKERRLP